ncbi:MULTISPECIES: hypothetical protein [Polymorphospora]|uniref:DUF3618 domain-containing protein n=1 Tax=Polymorphospora lycopeni TaxID=3140240 RepID=A0ABV5CUM3_9ACTN
MNVSKLGDTVVDAVADAAGTVADPRAGLDRLRTNFPSRMLAVLAVGVAIGYLVARSRRHA